MVLYSLSFYYPLILLIIPLVLLLLKKKTELNKQLPPGPLKLPIIGNLHQIGNLPHQSLWQLSKKHGSVMLIHLGRIPTIVVSSAEAAKEILKTHDLDCCSRPRLANAKKLTRNYLDIAFSPYGDNWREMRKICILEILSLKRTRSFKFIREEEVNSLMNFISQLSLSATPVNLSEKSYALTASIVFRMAFGTTFQGSGFDNGRLQELIHDAEAIAGCFSAEEYFAYVGWIVDRLTGCHAKVEEVFLKLDAFFQQVIDDHLKLERTEDQENIVDVLLKIEKDQIESGAARLTKENMKAIFLNLLLGGVDTAALTIVWAMAELVRNPRIMKKAQDEVRNSTEKKRRVTEGDIDQLQYLKLIIKETLRLHPPAPLLLPRETMSHFKLNGRNINPKMLIHINVWAIGRDPSYWKDPEKFFPERFVDSSIDFKGQNFEYLPFGSGRRICPGIHMGMATVELTLANLLYCFDWKLPSGMEEEFNMEEKAGLTVSKKIALRLVPVNYVE